MTTEQQVTKAAMDIMAFTEKEGMPASFALAALAVAYSRAAYLSGTRLVTAVRVALEALDATLDD